ncbi:MAG: acetyl-CoA carboxylase biotin carboxyl carrier protein [Cytophagales bacterium]|nr:acetyl-CoA carboxylase biotin carboxyl carrier protein [Cytophagales bacterium]MDW8384219.1 acetyl-CoA carboxylase biotin carboxyl carrier protein [Flammeovirgaceae bacterium]
MKVKEIQDLLGFIAASGLSEVNLKTSEIELHVKRNPDSPAPVPYVEPVASTMRAIPQIVSTPSAEPAVKSSQPADIADTSKYVTIKSPMVGTFYAAPSPEKPPFVQVGDLVKPGKVVCIIEAMKLFNEVESDVSGRIVKVLVENATPVEYDQPLFLVDPNV